MKNAIVMRKSCSTMELQKVERAVYPNIYTFWEHAPDENGKYFWSPLSLASPNQLDAKEMMLTILHCPHMASADGTLLRECLEDKELSKYSVGSSFCATFARCPCWRDLSCSKWLVAVFVPL